MQKLSFKTFWFLEVQIQNISNGYKLTVEIRSSQFLSVVQQKETKANENSNNPVIGTLACGSEVFPLQVEPEVTSEVSLLSSTCPSASFSLSVMEDDFLPPRPPRPRCPEVE